MGTLRILNGDFRSGRASFDNLSIELRGLAGSESVPLGLVSRVRKAGREKGVDAEDTIKTAVVGSVIGGIAAGAAAGGMTGPVGAILGAFAGAAITAKKVYPISFVELRDGRSFLAVAKEEQWLTFLEAVRRAKPVDLPAQAASQHETTKNRLRGLRDRMLAPLKK